MMQSDKHCFPMGGGGEGGARVRVRSGQNSYHNISYESFLKFQTLQYSTNRKSQQNATKRVFRKCKYDRPRGYDGQSEGYDAAEISSGLFVSRAT